MTDSDSIQVTHLILSGGGTKGAAIVGALKAIDDNGKLKTITHISASSVGAAIGLFLNIGLSVKDLYKMIQTVDFNALMDYSFLDSLTNCGLVRGARLMKFFADVLKNKGLSETITFIKLHELTGKTLIMTGSNLTTEKCDYFSHIHTPDVEVLTAVRISIAYPFFFTPVTFNGCTYTDGALFSPYPTEIFADVPAEKKIGILIDSERVFNCDYAPHNNADTFEQFLKTLMVSMMSRYVRLVCKNDFTRTIGIDLCAINGMNFDITLEVKEQMYRAGFEAAASFFSQKNSEE